MSMLLLASMLSPLSMLFLAPMLLQMFLLLLASMIMPSAHVVACTRAVAGVSAVVGSTVTGVACFSFPHAGKVF